MEVRLAVLLVMAIRWLAPQTGAEENAFKAICSMAGADRLLSVVIALVPFFVFFMTLSNP